MFGLGVGEILIILVIALIFLGPKKLPELAKGLGKGMREFQNAMRGINTTLDNPLESDFLKPEEDKKVTSSSSSTTDTESVSESSDSKPS